MLIICLKRGEYSVVGNGYGLNYCNGLDLNATLETSIYNNNKTTKVKKPELTNNFTIGDECSRQRGVNLSLIFHQRELRYDRIMCIKQTCNIEVNEEMVRENSKQ